MTQKTKEKRGRPKGSSAAKTRARILKVAARHFSATDYTLVRMTEIGSSAGLTGAAIYNHFSSKDDLFLETMKHILQKNVQTYRQASLVDGSWKNRLQAIVRLIHEDHKRADYSPVLTSLAQIKMVQSDRNFEEIRRLREEMANIFRELAVEAMESEDIPENQNPVIVGDLLMAFAFNALGTVMLHHQSEDETEDVLESFLALLKLGNSAIDARVAILS